MEQALNLLKADLGIKSTARDTIYYLPLLQSNAKELESKGVVLDLEKIEDLMLLSDYTAWKIRKRETGDPMPENVKQRILNKKVQKRSGKHD